MMGKLLAIVAVLVVLVGLCPMKATAGTVVELKASDIANPKGDGPDGKGNTDDDTWQFWYQYDTRSGFGPMHAYQKQPKQVPDGPNVEGWVYSNTPSVSRRGRVSQAADWDPDFEGIWGNKANGQIHMHPYTHHGLHAGVAITYRIPADGTYNISGGVTDVLVVKVGKHDGVIAVVEVVTDGKAAKGKELGRCGPVGDMQKEASGTFKIEKAALKKGELVRFIIDPNKWWGTDMTRIDSFKIEKVE